MNKGLHKTFTFSNFNKLLLFIFLFTAKQSNAQQSRIDSLKNELTHAKKDSAKREIFEHIAREYINASKLDSAIQIQHQALEFVKKSSLPPIFEIWELTGLSYLYMITGNYSEAMLYADRALQLSEQIKNNQQIAYSLSNFGDDYAGIGDLRTALDYYFRAKKVLETYESGAIAIQDIAETYRRMHMLDS